MKEYLINLTAYNIQANNVVRNMIDAAGEERCILNQASSFPTIKDTVIHIWNAQAIWIDRLNGVEIISWPGQTFNGTSAEAAHQLVESSKHFNGLVASLGDKDIQKKCNYKNIAGVAYTNTFFEIITHVMNHGTYHRGQIVTLLRGAGYNEINATDLINFYRENQ